MRIRWVDLGLSTRGFERLGLVLLVAGLTHGLLGLRASGAEDAGKPAAAIPVVLATDIGDDIDDT